MSDESIDILIWKVFVVMSVVAILVSVAVGFIDSFCLRMLFTGMVEVLYLLGVSICRDRLRKTPTIEIDIFEIPEPTPKRKINYLKTGY